MTLDEAKEWYRRGESVGLRRTLYPSLETDAERREAWIKEKREKIKESPEVYFAVYPFMFPKGASVEPSGSFFSQSQTYSGGFTLYWDKKLEDMSRSHEGFTYTISSPEKLAAIHTFRDWDAVNAYILANADSRVPLQPQKPRSLTVPETWFPGVWPMARSPWEMALHDGLPLNVPRENYDALPDELHDPVRFPLLSDVRKAAVAQGKDKKIRYTLSTLPKQEALKRNGDWRDRQHFFAEHFDLKEVLDAKGRVLSSESGGDQSSVDWTLALRLKPPAKYSTFVAVPAAPESSAELETRIAAQVGESIGLLAG
ncbi:hypothetical protein C8R46DRAFT_1038254 [Mycena filopes]|nr:hypothetical protein C8R46DRAFT_1038254 [Mycena filopes]